VMEAVDRHGIPGVRGFACKPISAHYR
jgi:hypothetical protein